MKQEHKIILLIVVSTVLMVLESFIFTSSIHFVYKVLFIILDISILVMIYRTTKTLKD